MVGRGRDEASSSESGDFPAQVQLFGEGGLRMAVRLIFSFDSEDYITPAADDAEKWWAETMTKHGITACICVVGELVRALQARGRRDVLTAMASHEIAYHSDKHSAPPTWKELLNAAVAADEFCVDTGCIPDRIEVGQGEVGPNAFMQAVAWLLRRWRTDGSLPASIPLNEVPELPKVANEP